MASRSFRVIDGDGERRKGRCSACARALNLTHRVDDVPVEFVYQPETVTVGSVELEPGWYCERCLKRAKRDT